MSALRKLNAARVRFHNSAIKKTGHNKFAGYNYFELGDFLVPALAIFNELDLCAVVSYGKDEASMTITDLDDGSQVVITSPMSSAALKGCHEVQNLGAVQTYLRRYLWVAALEIVEHDAIDSSEGAAKKTDKAAAKKDAGGVISATAGALDSLPIEERQYIEELAAYFKTVNHIPSIVDKIEEDAFEDMQYAALWSLLPSHIRSGIKKEQEARKVAA
jgi:hypothetical protein